MRSGKGLMMHIISFLIISSIISYICYSQTMINVTFDQNGKVFCYSTSVLYKKQDIIDKLGYDISGMTHMYDMQFYCDVPSYSKLDENIYIDRSTTNILDIVGDSNLYILSNTNNGFFVHMKDNSHEKTNFFYAFAIEGNAIIQGNPIATNDIRSIEIVYESGYLSSPASATNMVGEGDYIIIAANSHGDGNAPLMVGMARDSSTMPWQGSSGHTKIKDVISRTENNVTSSYKTDGIEIDSSSYSDFYRSFLDNGIHYLYVEYGQDELPDIIRHYHMSYDDSFNFHEISLTNTNCSSSFGPKSPDSLFTIGSIKSEGTYRGFPMPSQYSISEFMIFSIRTYNSKINLDRCISNVSNDIFRIRGNRYYIPPPIQE